MFLKFIIIIIVIAISLIFAYLFIYYFSTRAVNLASQKFEEWQKVYGRIEARQMTVDWLKKQLIVKNAGISEDGTIWLEFIIGIEADISTYPSETL